MAFCPKLIVVVAVLLTVCNAYVSEARDQKISSTESLRDVTTSVITSSLASREETISTSNTIQPDIFPIPDARAFITDQLCYQAREDRDKVCDLWGLDRRWTQSWVFWNSYCCARL